MNPAVNSIAYAFALRQRIYATIDKRTVPDNLKPGSDLWNKLVLFLETFDPVQMRYAGAEWKKLIELTEQIARATGSVRETT
jgi:COP9 signalosome complex subunit 3